MTRMLEDVSLAICESFLSDAPLLNSSNMILTIDNQFDGNLSENMSVEKYIPYEQRVETYIVPVVFAIVFIVGFLGNGTLIYIFLRHNTMRTIPNTYILSLAVGDFALIVATVPFISLIYTVESWPYGEFICKLSEFLKDLSMGVTVYTLTVLSFDRYLAIVQPIKKHTSGHEKKTTILMALGIWFVSACLSVPGAYFSYILQTPVSNDKTVSICYPFPEYLRPWYPRVVVLSKFLLLYGIPLIFIASFYVMMARHLISTSQNNVGQNPSHLKQLRSRTKVAKIVLAFVVIFAVCFFPGHVFMLWFYFDPNSNTGYNEFWHACKIMGYILTFASSCLNPIALYFISGVFRNHFKRYLFCWCSAPTEVRHETITMESVMLRRHVDGRTVTVKSL